MRTLAELESWLGLKESPRLEFKEAKHSFDSDKLVRYCAALANEGGGDLVLGVSDRRPRRIVGTLAFGDVDRLTKDLLDRLHLRIEITELAHVGGRVLVFTAPPRPIGRPIAIDGAYWMRAGESLVTMTADQLERIFDEGVPDFSASVCAGASLADLSPTAMVRFRELVAQRRSAAASEPLERVLEDAELTVDGAVTYAALIMLGSPRGLGRHLATSEIVFEARNEDTAVAYAHRTDLRDAFLSSEETIW